MTPQSWDQETDVLIVGGGGAGLAAAVEASALGARVMLLEKLPHLGGTTSIAVGSFTAARTTLQSAAGVLDGPAWHDEDIGKFAPHLECYNNRPLRRVLTEHAGETLSWLMDLGLQFHGPSREPPNRVPRMHNVVPNAKAYIAALQRHALRTGVRMFLEHRVQTLVRGEEGRVLGLEARAPDGRSVRIAARKGVILAAGDYSNGPEVKSEYLPPEISAIEGINPNSTGDGHRLAKAAGAELLNMDIVYGPEIRFVPPPRAPFTQLLPANPPLAKMAAALVGLLPKAVLTRAMKSLLVTWQHPETSLFRQGAILINRNGEIFADEKAAPELAIPQQPGKIAYILLDHRLAELYSKWPNFISTAPEIAYAYVQDYKRLRPDVYAESDSLEGLAAKIRVAPSALHKSVEARPAFGRRGPFIALGPVKSWIVTTEGGVRINERMEALDARGAVIPGLYAAGSTGMGGIVVWGHGLHIAWALTSGRLAGRNAAES
jgi:fumarate reductase flavoprotein subunit